MLIGVQSWADIRECIYKVLIFLLCAFGFPYKTPKDIIVKYQVELFHFPHSFGNFCLKSTLVYSYVFFPTQMLYFVK